MGAQQQQLETLFIWKFAAYVMNWSTVSTKGKACTDYSAAFRGKDYLQVWLTYKLHAVWEDSKKTVYTTKFVQQGF